jgi:hypothetical protein
LLTYNYYIQACLVEDLSQEGIWDNLSSSERQHHLDHASRLSSNSNIHDSLSLFEYLNFWNLSLVYNANLVGLIHDYQNNVNKYIEIVLNSVSKSASQSLQRITDEHIITSEKVSKHEINVTTVNDKEIIHTLNYKGEPYSYNIKDLFWNPKAYDYLKEQGEIFDRYLPELVENFAGKYVVFENGLVIDSDRDENTLLDRIVDTEFYKQRPDAILLTFVPKSLPIENIPKTLCFQRTPEETAEGLRKMTELFKRQQDLWNSMTEEEREISNSEFLTRHEELVKSRSE